MTVQPCIWKERRVLVSGHTGFKGSWLTLWLLKLGAIVRGVSLEPEGDPHLFHQLGLADRIIFHIADIHDLPALMAISQASDPEVVQHLAAQPLVPRSYPDPLGAWSTNLQGSLHVLEALRPLAIPVPW